jgi:hypothetical protein
MFIRWSRKRVLERTGVRIVWMRLSNLRVGIKMLEISSKE